MSEEVNSEANSFYQRPNVKLDTIQIGGGMPFGIEQVSNKELGIGGAYGSWGKSFSNANLPEFVESRMGHPLGDNDQLELGDLGFDSRQHVPVMTQEENHQLELEVGARLIKEAAQGNGWEPSEVEGLLVGMSGPITNNYLSEIAQRAGFQTVRLKSACIKPVMDRSAP